MNLKDKFEEFSGILACLGVILCAAIVIAGFIALVNLIVWFFHQSVLFGTVFACFLVLFVCFTIIQIIAHNMCKN